MTAQALNHEATLEEPEPLPASVKKLRPIIIAVISVMFFISAVGLFLSLPGALRGQTDFRHLYTAGYMVRTGHSASIYDFAESERFQKIVVGPAEGALPFDHLAYESLFYLPFSLLNYKFAYLTYLAVNLGILTAALRLMRGYHSKLIAIWRYFPFAAGGAFVPVAVALLEGQDSPLLLALFAAAMIDLQRKQDVRAGVLVGLTLFKFQYALPFAMLFIIRRRWRFVSGFAVSAICVVGLSIWLVGFSGATTYAHTLLRMSAKFTWQNGLKFGVHPEGMPNIRGLAFMISHGSRLFTDLGTLAFSLIILVWAGLKKRAESIPLITMLLVSYHQVIADTTLLLLPLSIILDEPPSLGRKQAIKIGLICLTFALPLMLLFAGTRFYLAALPILALFAISE